MAKSTQLYDESGEKLYPFSLTTLIFDAAGGLLEARLQALEMLLDWFELDEENNLIKANHGIYSVGPLTAGGKATDKEFPNAVNRLQKLRDVLLTELQDGEALVYDAESGMWVNKAGGSSGSDVVNGVNATLESAVTTDAEVGFIKKSQTLPEGMTFTEFVLMMFSQAVKATVPSVTLSGVPTGAVEIGSSVTLNLSITYKDGYYTNTKDGTTQAGCQQGTPAYTLNGLSINNPYNFTASEAREHTVAVSLPYGASTAVVTNKAGSDVNMPISAGTAKDSGSFIVGYRAFWGYMTDGEAENLTSALIRGLEHSDMIINPNSTTITLLNSENQVPGGEDLMIAVPEGYTLYEVTDKTTSMDFSKKFTTQKVTVACAGDTTKNYTVYRYDNYNDSPMYITKIVIKKEA